MSDSDAFSSQIGDIDKSQWPRLHDEMVRARLETALNLDSLDASVCDLLVKAASGSPYLERLFLRWQSHLPLLLAAPPEELTESIIHDALCCTGPAETVKADLRKLKDRLMIVLSLYDLSGVWSDLQVMDTLSRFADAAVIAAFNSALQEVMQVTVPGAVQESGMAVLAMGKHGAFELNYSSDIDLVVFYDAGRLQTFLERDGVPERLRDARKVAARVTQLAVSILQDQTADGYVFRTDLRLRPDPGTSAAAVTIEAAERYYENYGQNWERAAFSKARIIAGHADVQKKIKAFLTPFIWRKYLDFAAIEDIHSIKRQIHAVKGMGGFDFADHDIKLGRGGIREVEFYVQTQQLILGGRNPALRERTTLGGLQALASAGHIRWDVEHELRDAYLFLRCLEHRLQMVNDAQTHQIPKDPAHILRVAHLAGYDDADGLKADTLSALNTVHDHYAELFEEGERLTLEKGSLVFTGVDDHPDTLKTLENMGFDTPASVSSAIRKWHAGGIRATRSARAREILTRLVPVILQSLSRTDTPQQAFQAFDLLLRQLPAGVQFFSLLQSNVEILDTLIRLCTLSPRLGQSLASHAHLIESLVSETFVSAVVEDDRSDTEPEDLLALVQEAGNFEDQLNTLRREVREARFRVTYRMLMTQTSVRDLARHYSRLADAAIEAALPTAHVEMCRNHGPVTGELAVIGLGRLGADSLTIVSDLDLIFVYDTPDGARSSHERPLDAVNWFTRYVRRFVTALSAQTEEGSLYDVDMALRPSGGAGPAAVRLPTFRRYYESDAWTWEEMAMVKARAIAGDAGLVQTIDAEIEAILTRKRDAEKVRGDVLAMRYRLLKEKPPAHGFDLKRLAGGLTDIDFICQYLALVHGAEHGRFPRHIADMLPVFAAQGIMSSTHQAQLLGAWQDYEIVLQLRRAALGYARQGQDMSQALLEVIGWRLGGEQPEQIEDRLITHTQHVKAVFRDIVGPF
ncbi:bifunctional [glutamine synthetase] adenylyltransferase/[glutamine synthetase]-adenylyl-L-tyrosine phosphorylase [Parvularcula sp. IMCC14364]|uniref:bifunctional [glutamine synthetase] adenylyltransferase/[glutamine synthetase]-adenylyl-L-tyrosine phosphorylase n=1 Tax=Parvularcula sp. IMCC14364 TaxID=3067902 RepID=UPI0027407948|nr:bifunctional [glutamine synthetase] adenylyltransferase/[glutamine synthetase]-adenylyl-L-tyrosine phosphorylase [Parvularcula sp. IMCC14364]